MAKTTIELPEAVHRRVRVLAALEGRSMNEIVVTALTGYLETMRIEPGMLELELVPRGGSGTEVPGGA